MKSYSMHLNAVSFCVDTVPPPDTKGGFNRYTQLMESIPAHRVIAPKV